MPVLSLRVSDDFAVRFDAAAALVGGRSALLRRLVGGAELGEGEGGEPIRRPASGRLMVRLGTPEAAHVQAEAGAMGLRPSAWVAALVRRHARGTPRFSRAEELAILAMQKELRRIGVNVNQIARALNTAVMEGRVLESELSYAEDLRRELRAHLAALREAFEGNLAYWQVAA